jgi:hypothetical protein
MQPQTNAELTAWNLGRAAGESDVSLGVIESLTVRTISPPLSPAELQARDILGPVLFWQWADRGYNVVIAAAVRG